MPQFTADLDVLRHALFDHSLSQVGESLFHVKVDTPLPIKELVFSPGVDVRVFNRPEDKDADAVFGGGEAAHIPFALQSAWLKYTLTAK